jgi:hypothetical protein
MTCIIKEIRKLKEKSQNFGGSLSLSSSTATSNGASEDSPNLFIYYSRREYKV